MVHSIQRPQSRLERGQPIVIEAAGATDTGKVRQSNEDQFLVANLRRSLAIKSASLPLSTHDKFQDTGEMLLIVADGIGGYAGGALASSTATRHLASDLLWSLGVPTKSNGNGRSEEVRDRLTAAIARSHQAVRRLANRPDVDPHLGTTVTLGYLEWPHLHVAHVGDSRCYLLHDGHLERLTTDHTIAEQIRNSDVFSAGQQPLARYEHVLTNSVGSTNEPDPEVETHKLQRSDVILLCSDGITGPISDRELASILVREPSPEKACAHLISLARERGGEDNATVVIARVG